MKNIMCVFIITVFVFSGAGIARASSVSIQLISSSAGVSPGQTISFAASASGFTNPTYSLSDSFSGSSVSNSNISNNGYFSWTPTISDAGTHQITVAVTDTNNDNASSTITIQVVSNAVFIQNLAPGTMIGVGRALTFTASAPGFINPVFTLSDSYPGTNITNADINSIGGFSWTPGVDQQGVHQLTMYGYDAYGHSGNTSQSITVTDPQIGNVHTFYSGNVGTLLSFTALASGLATTTFSVSDAFSSGTSTIVASTITNSGVFSWTPSESDIGTHQITITATDTFGNSASAATQLFISAASASPVVTSPPVTTTTTSTTAPNVTAAAPTQSISAINNYHFTSQLKLGLSNADVTALQQFLIASGYSLPSGATGYFGSQTEAAVAAFQKANNLPATGYVGSLTLALLNQNATATTPATSSSSLTTTQINAIISVLQSFGADSATIASVRAALDK